MTSLPGKDAEPIRDRILRLAARDGASGCWIWPNLDVSGYGQIWVGSRNDGTRRRMLAHRASYETFCGPIPDGLGLDHLCATPACVNPDHLEPVTNRENLRRRDERLGRDLQPGSIYQRKSDGLWVAAVAAGGGRRRRVFYGRTREAAAAKLAAFRDGDSA